MLLKVGTFNGSTLRDTHGSPLVLRGLIDVVLVLYIVVSVVLLSRFLLNEHPLLK